MMILMWSGGKTSVVKWFVHSQKLLRRPGKSQIKSKAQNDLDKMVKLFSIIKFKSSQGKCTLRKEELNAEIENEK